MDYFRLLTLVNGIPLSCAWDYLCCRKIEDFSLETYILVTALTHHFHLEEFRPQSFFPSFFSFPFRPPSLLPSSPSPPPFLSVLAFIYFAVLRIEPSGLHMVG